MKAHRTTYNGVNFRSRLEAKWAAFFDLLGWRWQYEPIDLDGWAPDFSIAGHNGPIYVEVKPIEWVGDHDSNIRQAKEYACLDKVFAYSGNREVLILGTHPQFMDTSKNGWGCTFGLLFEKECVGLDAASLWRGQNGGYDFSGFYGSFEYRLSGEYDGDHHLRGADLALVGQLWRSACNRVQWRGAAA